MSTIRDPAVITTAGRQMMTAGGDISYTKAVLFGQDISHLTQEQLVSLTSIGNPLMTVPVGISDKNNAGANTTVVLEATFQNTDLKADLPYKAVGFFAKKDNGEEKLVILGVANSGAYLAAASPDGVASDALDVKLAIAIGDATSVTAVVDPAGSVTPATLNGAINKATHDLTAKIDDVNNAKSSLTSSINAVNNKVNVTVPLFRRITAANTWNDILGASNGDTPVLVSIRDEGGANTLGNYSAAVAFGGGDTKGVLNVAYSDHTARIIGGNGNAPVWHEDIAWKSDISNLQNIINQQNQTIQSLTSRLNNAENEINYIKANYVEGRTFPASQEAQANSWENENPQRIAFITK